MPRGFKDKGTTISFQIGYDGGTGKAKDNYNIIDFNLGVTALDGKSGKRAYGLNAVEAGKQLDFTSSKKALSAAPRQINLATVSKARKAINSLDEDIVKIADVQAVFGALQNRFTQVQNTNTAYSNALSSARSRIMDADFATEASNMTKYNILQQAGTAMLRQANMTPQAALTLLQ